MNKLPSIIVLLLILITSCTKNLQEGNYITVAVTASLDTSSLTKTHMVDEDGSQYGLVKWSPTDYLTLFNGYTGFTEGRKSSLATNISVDGKTAVFLFDITEEELNIIKYLPDHYLVYGNTEHIQADKGVPSAISLDAKQYYAGDRCFQELLNVAIGHSSGSIFKKDNESLTDGVTAGIIMRNIFGILKINVDLAKDHQDKVIKYVTLTDNASSGNNFLAGTFKITYDSNYYPIISHNDGTGGDSHTIEVECNDNVAGSRTFYFLVPPGTLCTDAGFNVYVYTKEGYYAGKKVKNLATNNVSINRSEITQITLGSFNPNPPIALLKPTANTYLFSNSKGLATIPAEYEGNSFQGDGITVAAKSHQIKDAENTSNSTWYADILWQTRMNGNTLLYSDVIGSPVYFEKEGSHYISFNRSGLTGNALVALKNGNGTILWSWLIWIAGTAADSTTIYDGIQLKKATGYESTPDHWIMDRNIGALSLNTGPESHGTAFQYGRKDPFLGSRGGNAKIGSGYDAFVFTAPQQAIGTESENVSILQGIRNPTVRYGSSDVWSNQTVSWVSKNMTTGEIGKNLYDPCPVGWRMIETNDVLSVLGATIDSSGSTHPIAPAGDIVNGDDCNYMQCLIAAETGKYVIFPFTGVSKGLNDLDAVGKGAYLWGSSKASMNSNQAYGLKLSTPTSTETTATTDVQFMQFGYLSTMPVRCLKFTEPAVPTN